LVNLSAAQQIATDIRAGFKLMLAVSALPASMDADRRVALVDAIRDIDDSLALGKAPQCSSARAQDLDTEVGEAEKQAWDALRLLAGASEP
ncbi:hypothetical protein, partial [Vibrio vulnificus]|uniref:hypothetical protein n=1 Tax=Vibrio vulnificus TaxID=672 RepID=UPI0019D41C6B